MAAMIHPTAIVDRHTQIGDNVAIGAYTVIEGDVVLGDGCEIGPHVMIGEHTRIGKECRLFNGACVGLIPQDLKFRGETTFLRIGDRTTIREFCTLNRGTAASGETVIGSGCLLLAYCHVGHDCVLGDHVVISNNLAMAGHVQVGNHVTIGGLCGFHQFVRIGDYSMIGAFSFVTQDVMPFALTAFDPVRVVDINKVKLERCNFAPDRVQNIKRAYRILFRQHLELDESIARLDAEFPGSDDIRQIVAFARNSTRGILRMRNAPPKGAAPAPRA